jgi:EmrB/QacA subfamily drug resistance transporter
VPGDRVGQDLGTRLVGMPVLDEPSVESMIPSDNSESVGDNIEPSPCHCALKRFIAQHHDRYDQAGRALLTARTVSTRARWILAASVLGSGAAFLEGTVVTVALPAIGRDLGLGMEGLQWVMTLYLLTLSALMLLGGSLGDRYGRARVFAIGAIGFGVFTTVCAMAPTTVALYTARLLQGVAGALLVPNSLAMLDEAFTGEARGAAVGQWAGWSGVSTAAGPLIGGWLAEHVSWRWVFAVVIPFAVSAAVIAATHVRSGRTASSHSARSSNAQVDYPGAILVSLGLAGVLVALVEGPRGGFGRPFIIWTLGLGIVLLAIFAVVESRTKHPLLPLEVFKNRQFTGVNLTTLLVYAALNGLLFLLMLELQNALHWGPGTAGMTLLPVNALMLVLSPRAGRLAERIGPRLPMVVGALTAGVGCALFSRVQPGATYLSAILPATIVFGLGLSAFVAPLTGAALRAAGAHHASLASGVNNAVARLAGLLATAAIPLAAGLGGLRDVRGPALASGFARGMFICGVLCVLGAVGAWAMVPGTAASTRDQ